MSEISEKHEAEYYGELGRLTAERDALRERVERYEKALKEIAENYTEETDYEYLGMKKLMDIAKAALSIPEGER